MTARVFKHGEIVKFKSHPEIRFDVLDREFINNESSYILFNEHSLNDILSSRLDINKDYINFLEKNHSIKRTEEVGRGSIYVVPIVKSHLLF